MQVQRVLEKNPELELVVSYQQVSDLDIADSPGLVDVIARLQSRTPPSPSTLLTLILLTFS